MEVSIYTDGAARGNPNGPGGYGTILVYIDSKGNTHTKELSCGYKKTTNNRMELMAAIEGLKALKEPCEVELFTDSAYLHNAFSQGWLMRWQKNMIPGNSDYSFSCQFRERTIWKKPYPVIGRYPSSFPVTMYPKPSCGHGTR